MTIFNSVYSESYGMGKVDGEIKNNDSVKHSAFLKATFYDANNKIMGTASGAVNEVVPGETKTFTLVASGTVTGYSSMKVQIDTLM